MRGPDALLSEAAEEVITSGEATVGRLVATLGVGSGRAARILLQLEAHGLVGPHPGGGRSRQILVPLDQLTSALNSLPQDGDT